jgi:hypothetical protein
LRAPVLSELTGRLPTPQAETSQAGMALKTHEIGFWLIILPELLNRRGSDQYLPVLQL